MQLDDETNRTITTLKTLFETIDPRMSRLSTQELAQTGQIFQNFAKRQKKEKSRLALDFFEQARIDLGSSKLLYGSKDFRNSVSLFQQCVEKACKAYGLSTGLISRKDLRKISHQSPLVFIRMLKNQIINDNLIGLLEKFTGENARIKIDNAEELIKSKRKDLIKMSEQQLNSYIEFVKQGSDRLSDALQDKLTTIGNMLKGLMPDLELNISVVILQSILPFKLYVLSIVTYQHWQRSHYPDTYPLAAKNYNENLPLVKALPKLHDIATTTLLDLERFLNTPSN